MGAWGCGFRKALRIRESPLAWRIAEVGCGLRVGGQEDVDAGFVRREGREWRKMINFGGVESAGVTPRRDPFKSSGANWFSFLGFVSAMHFGALGACAKDSSDC